jgi:hypothetical protein
VVNRIFHLLDSARARPVKPVASQSPGAETADRLVEVLESQMQQRPKLWLGIAFVAGAGLAWWIKRK